MKILLAIIFASIAACGNAIFALGQKNSDNVKNGVLFIGISAFLAVILSIFSAPMIGNFNIIDTLNGNLKAISLSGFGLFLTYLGFNLLYTKCGVSYYIIYAVLSIITTTIFIGILWLKEPINIYHIFSIILSTISLILFSIGQMKLN